MKFEVITGKTITKLLQGNHKAILDQVASAYLAFHQGDAVNPDSYFLRFPKQTDSRIIALPAHIDSDIKVSGIKWISSYPGNIKSNLPRASALLILNDYKTGYPFACMESSIISAARTAASAALGARLLSQGNNHIKTLGIIGNGLISRYILQFLLNTGFTVDRVNLFDIDKQYSQRFRERVYEEHSGLINKIEICDSKDDTISNSEVVIFATTAGTPHIQDIQAFSHNPLVLHVSLRDLSPDVILASHNIVDDVDHCLKAQTSLHLAEQLCGNRDFVHGSLAEVILSDNAPKNNKPIIFTPFGMGILDIAVGYHLYKQAKAIGETHSIDNFFFDLDRI